MTMAATSAPVTRRMTREDLVRIGQSGRPWEFAGMGLQAVRMAPGDVGLRVLLAANLARLGLKTAAREQLEQVPPAAAADPAVLGLAQALGGLPEDRIDPASIAAVCRANIEVLAARGVELGAEFARWQAVLGEWEWFRAAGGNVVRRRGDAWLGLGDHRGAAERFGAQHLKPDPQINAYTLEGVDPPWLLEKVAAVSPRQKDGFQPRLVVVQADAMEFLDGLGHADLRGVLGEERTAVFVGDGAGERLRAELRERRGAKLAGPYIPLLGVRRRVEPAVTSVIQAAQADQESGHERLVAEVAAIYTGRDRAWWRERYSAGGEPLRVLVPTCRYSTFVRHSSADLVEAFNRAGCRAELMIEPDASWRFSSLAYLEKIKEFKPDLMVLINYARAHLGAWLPAELPFVCWIQDAMPHQFDAAVGGVQTERDFLVGCVHEELVERFGYPRERVLRMPVAASATKFHDGPVEKSLLEKHRCEISLVSHHSETPERMHERLVDEAGRGGPIQGLLESLRPLVWELASDPAAGVVHSRLEAASASGIQTFLGREPDPRTLAMVFKNYCLPLADRVLRHQTLAWAAEMTRRRGWRLHIYGRGWGEHPTLARFAKGELEHGESLRAAYQGAAVNLHASINTLAHQRVMECALSGGLPLCRLLYEVIMPLRSIAHWRASLREEPPVCNPQNRWVGHFAADHPEWAAYTGILQRLGLPHEPFCWVTEARRASYLAKAAAGAKAPGVPGEAQAMLWLVGDIGETTFATAARLEELVGRAIESPQWRRGWSGLMAGRVRERFAHGAMVGKVLGLVKESLA